MSRQGRQPSCPSFEYEPSDPQINAEIFLEGAPIRWRYIRIKAVLVGYPLRMTTVLLVDTGAQSEVLRSQEPWSNQGQAID